MKTRLSLSACALAVTLTAGCTMADETPATKPPNLIAELLPEEQITYSGIGPDGTSVIGFGTGYPVLVKEADGTPLDASHAEAAFAVATAACESAGHNAPHPNAFDIDHATGGIRFRGCG